MGAPKQKWTSEEEAALKAGVVKHGAGKWRTILMDPEFSSILHLRSNVDLKDKWRNMNVMASGLGSRHRAKLALKNQIIPKDHPKDHEAMALSTVVRSGEEIIDAKPLAISRGPLRIDGSKKAISRLDNRILEAIANLKDPSGSNKTDIASYIEKQYWTPPNFKKLLSSKLKLLAGNGKLIKVKGNYWIAPSLTSPVVRRNSAPSLTSPVVRRNSSMPFTEGKQKDSPKADNSDIKSLSKSQIDADLVKMRSMTAQEAAMAAARAVAEAEAAIAEAEEAAREAEEAEAEAEAAHVFAEAAFKALKCRILRTW